MPLPLKKDCSPKLWTCSGIDGPEQVVLDRRLYTLLEVEKSMLQVLRRLVGSEGELRGVPYRQSAH